MRGESMRVLLINPDSSVVSKSWAYRKFCAPIAPLGLAYLSAVLEKDGFEVAVYDQFALKTGDDDLLRKIASFKPEVIGAAALTTVVPDIKRMISRIRAENTDVTIILGHIHATCFPSDMLGDGMADIVVRGEGEDTLLEVCRNIRCGKSWRETPGISYNDDGAVVDNPDRPLRDDLDSLPLPAWHLFDADLYKEAPLVAINRSRAFPIIASRGCKYRCYYCSQDKVYPRMRFRDLEKVADEMEYFVDTLRVGYFGFSDAYFPWDEDSGLRFCRIIIRRGLHKKVRWCTETRVDKVTPRLLRAMKEAGAHLIMYGIEVGSREVLERLNKHTTLEQARFAVRETAKAGIFSQGLFILGLPGETPATCRQTIDFAKELNCDIVKFNLAVPYPGSRFFEEHGKKLIRESPEKFTSWADWTHLGGGLVYAPQGMSGDTLRHFQRKGMMEYYARPGVIIKNLARGTITLRNLILGGSWLLFIFLFGSLKKTRRIFLKRS